nr:uncharacterized protein LOC116767707 [Danaus plexippus plexippus]
MPNIIRPPVSSTSLRCCDARKGGGGKRERGCFLSPLPQKTHWAPKGSRIPATVERGLWTVDSGHRVVRKLLQASRRQRVFRARLIVESCGRMTAAELLTGPT